MNKEKITGNNEWEKTREIELARKSNEEITNEIKRMIRNEYNIYGRDRTKRKYTIDINRNDERNGWMGNNEPEIITKDRTNKNERTR